MTTDVSMFAQLSSISRSISFQRKIKTTRLEGLSFRPKVSECLCKNFFEANIICPKNLFDFSTKVQKCLWSCQMTLITSSKLTSKHPLCDIMSFSYTHTIKKTWTSLSPILSVNVRPLLFCFWEVMAWCSGWIIISDDKMFTGFRERNKSLAEAIDVTDKQYFCHPGIGDRKQSALWR